MVLGQLVSDEAEALGNFGRGTAGSQTRISGYGFTNSRTLQTRFINTSTGSQAPASQCLRATCRSS